MNMFPDAKIDGREIMADKTNVLCPTCKGDGRYLCMECKSWIRCPTCKGKGSLSQDFLLNLACGEEVS